MKKKAFYTDIFRTLKNNFSRFLAILVMVALGTGVFIGFTVGCMDVLDSADRFYDNQNTYDVKIASTLGLTSDDLSALAELDQVSAVFGNQSMDVMITQSDGNQLLANVTTLDSKGMNHPYVLEGALPTKSGQIAVNSKFIHDTGFQIGDRIHLDEVATEDTDTTEGDSTAPSLKVKNYEITAIILSPLNISNTESSVSAISFSSSSMNYLMYLTKDCIDSEIFTTAYLTLEGTAELDSFSTEYQSLVKKMTDNIKKTIREERQQARYQDVTQQANDKITEAEQLLADKISETDQKLLDAQTKIDEGMNSYKEGLEEVQSNEKKLTDGQRELDSAILRTNKKLTSSQQEIDDNLAQLNAKEKELNSQESVALENFSTHEQELLNGQEAIDNQRSEADVQLNGIITSLSIEAKEIWKDDATQKVWSNMILDGEKAAPYLLIVKEGGTPSKEPTEAYNQAMAELQSDTQALDLCFALKEAPLSEEQINAFSGLSVTFGTINYSQTKLDENSASLAAQKTEALKQIAEGRKQITEGKTKLSKGQKELDSNKRLAKAQFEEKQLEINKGLQQLEDAKKKLSDALIELTDGQKGLDQNKSEYEKSIASAKQELDQAKEDTAKINMAKWYVWDRSENDSFSGIDNDISFIQAITKAFPIIFFLVAILVSLTTMTRMVEEDRALIGTYKSLGYSKFHISLKYIIYAILACVAGGMIGNVIGFLVLPKVITIIVENLYVLPTFHLFFYPIYGLGGFGLFLLGIVGATIMSCIEMLHKRPSELMRPKAPKEGNRILLERVPFLWKRLNFLNKVTCRNLFRYKKRAIMTIVGILGCMMLIVLGFGVRDSVNGLMSDQFKKVTVYDAIVVTDQLKTDEMNQLQNEWITSGTVKEAMQLQISTLTLWSKDNNLNIPVMVIPDDADLGAYVNLKDVVTKKKKTLPTEGVVVTQNAAKQLKLKSGDMISLQNEDNLECDFPIAFVTVNNAGNYIYISESCYQAAFGDYAGASFLLNLEDDLKGQLWLNTLSEDSRILNVNSSQEVQDIFGDIKKIVSMVVYLLISMSAILALTVLFTLSNINASERERELATIKVLGFKHKEVYSYVNKETFILTFLGILLGMPAGYGVTYAILANVSIADIAFNVRVSVAAYLFAALLTLTFTLLVNKITNKTLRNINMVEALKSVE